MNADIAYGNQQSLYRQAANIVERFERSTKLSEADKQIYRDALKQLRLPYWDYFRPRAVSAKRKPFDYHVPWIFTFPHVMVKTLPDNEIRSLENPFFNYKFGKDDLTEEEWKKGGMAVSSGQSANCVGKANKIEQSRYDDHTKTIRWGGNEKSHHKNLNKMVNKIREDNMRMVLLMIDDENPNGYPNFQVYSTVGVSPKQDLVRNFPRFGSLESTHGTYHVYVGGFLEALTGKDFKLNDNQLVGHLMAVPLSAFDPIFWFHHWYASIPKSSK